MKLKESLRRIPARQNNPALYSDEELELKAKDFERERKAMEKNG